MTQWREHAPEGQDCWCKHLYPVYVNGVTVGMATPLEDGSYAIVFYDNEAGRQAEKDISGNPEFSGFSIQEPVQEPLFRTEELN